MTIAYSTPLSDQQHFVLDYASWELYQQLLADIGDRPLRVTFDNGNLEMMAPLPIHELWKSYIRRLIERMAEELDIELQSFGSTTFNRKDLAQGLEPDECFYIRHFKAVRKKRRLNLKFDPPPDLAIEIDITSRSVPREPIYAGLGVPELWRFDGRRLHVLHLTKGKYVPRETSLSFPFLPINEFEAYLLRMENERPINVLKEFVAWIRGFSKDVEK